MQSTGLSAPSIVRQKLFTIDMRLIIESIGSLSEKDIESVKNILIADLCIQK